VICRPGKRSATGRKKSRKNIRARSGFRSPQLPCLSEKVVHVNVPGWLTATTLTTRAPGRENRRCADCSPHPWGSPLRGQRKRCPKLLPAILSSAYPFRLSGRARCNVPVSHALSPHPCGLPRPQVNASAIFSRTQHLALISSIKWRLCRCMFLMPDGGFALLGLQNLTVL